MPEPRFWLTASSNSGDSPAGGIKIADRNHIRTHLDKHPLDGQMRHLHGTRGSQFVTGRPVRFACGDQLTPGVVFHRLEQGEDVRMPETGESKSKFHEC